MQDKCMKNDNTLHTSTPRVSPTWLPNKMAMVCMQSILAKQNKTKYHSPSMTLSWLPIKNDLVPRKKLLKILSTIAIMVNTMTRACPV